MADNTDEEHLDNPINNQSENPPDEIIPTTDTETINSIQETENMEVHHHAHDPEAPHHKKNWKSYFWEFLMLFLAVFCGFLAEYQLEHKIERDRGKQYTYSFYEDLKTDSSHFNDLISRFTKKLTVFQDMSPCYDSLLSSSSINCLTNIYINSRDFPDLIYTDRTLMQLKNAGGLRLLKKTDADSILLYDKLLQVYKAAETTGLQNIQNDVRETSALLRDYGKWKDTTQQPRIFAIYGNNKDLLNKYFNHLTLYDGFCRARLNNLLKLKKGNAELIEYFKAKYHYD
ncbi:MAG: hypothetical protein EAZ16_04235 [Sphingobacteriales bacterium]|nr:MAG: hypothetical protein EAZ16_04235 [Sphingobacteriales bacterium]